MALRRIDENGVYREVDAKTGLFKEGEFPLASSLGQIEHQTVATNHGRIIDRDELPSDVVEETGVAVLTEDEVKVKHFIKEAISIDNLVETFNDNSHETLLKLLALQDNKHPLKKGGIGIAYRTDALIMHCKMEFSAEENVVFDAILGTISSYPEDKTYRIEPASFTKYSRYKSENSLYDTFKRGTKKLADRHLIFEELGPEGKDDIIVPWFDILRYHRKDKNDVAYIEFKPSEFFKDLALCSGIIHGAFGSLEVTTQLQGKYTIALYWYLENMKNYKEYPGATPGVFEISLEELKHQFSIPVGYIKGDIDRRVLKPARESINAVNECDFTFDYEAKYVNKKHVGYRFEVKSKNYIDSTATEIYEIEEKDVDPLKEQVASIFSLSSILFEDAEIDKIISCMKRNNKDLMALMQILPVFKSRIENNELDPVDNKVAYLCRMIQDGVSAVTSSKEKSSKKKSGFSNFNQRDYDMDALEKKLLN